MSIKTLLENVNRNLSTLDKPNEPKPLPENTAKQSEAPEIQSSSPGSISFKELLEKYSEIRSWLETHECQTGTSNKLDVNDRPYDHELYCKRLKELEEVAYEILNRPLLEGLEEQIKKYGL